MSIKKHLPILLVALGYGILLQALSLNLSFDYFRDELYYLSCAKHLDWGYVDRPPFSIFMLWIVTRIFGSSMFAIRLLASVSGAVAVFLSGKFVSDQGGKQSSSLFAALASASIILLATMCSFYSMNALEPVFWMLIIHFVVKILKFPVFSDSIWLGVISGLSILNKHTAAVFIFAVALGILLSAERKKLFSRYFLIALIIAAVMQIPQILWQFAHGFPSLEFYHNAGILKNNPTGAAEIILMQILTMNVLLFPFWLLGLWHFFRTENGKLRFIFFTYIIMLGIMIVSRSSRPDRIIGLYPLLISGGMLWAEQAALKIRRISIIRTSLVVFAVLAFIALTPIFLPVLSVDATAAYTKASGISLELERGNRPQLFQVTADRIGWEQLAKDVSKVYMSLPPEERENTVVTASNYGQAGAVDLFGSKYPLPKNIICPQNNWYFWSDISRQHSAYINLGDVQPRLQEFFVEVQPALLHSVPYRIDHENNRMIFISRKPKIKLQDVWKSLKDFM